MSLPKRPQIYVFSKGKLKTKEVQCQTQISTVIDYDHTIRQSPDQYHTQVIKQYKKELDEMRRNYYQLQKAYYLLLGYKWEGTENSRVLPEPRATQYFKLSAPSQQSIYLESAMKKSNFIDFNDANTDIQDMKTKVTKLTQSFIQVQNDNLSARPSFGPSEKIPICTRTSLKTKTQTDEQYDVALMNAMNEIQDLKFALEQAHITCEREIEEFKESYEEHIRKLEEILERERKHTKMLNGVIARSRTEIQAKDNLIKSIMGMKNSDKGAIEKLVKQFKIKV